MTTPSAAPVMPDTAGRARPPYSTKLSGSTSAAIPSRAVQRPRLRCCDIAFGRASSRMAARASRTCCRSGRRGLSDLGCVISDHTGSRAACRTSRNWRSTGSLSYMAARTDKPVSMEARQVDELPHGEGWQYEPKWDGFRCIARRNGKRVDLLGRSGKSLARYFPEIVAALAKLEPRRFVLDGELVIPTGATLFFATLGEKTRLRLSPATERHAEASRWLARAGSGELDGVVGKRLDEPYRAGERAMLKIKCLRSADCVVGGFRYATAKR